MKTIEICSIKYNIDCNALTHIKYRKIFNTDIFKDIKTLNTFLTKQVLIAENLKKENPNISDEIIITSLSRLMVDDMGLFVEAATRMAYVMICTANDNVVEYEEWLKNIPTLKTNDNWISEVTEFAVECFC